MNQSKREAAIEFSRLIIFLTCFLCLYFEIPSIAFGEYRKLTLDEIQRKLSPEQFQVTQSCGTEPAFHNKYWDNHEAGIYVDVVTGEPLFSSKDKFDSGSGWPSFSRPIEESVLKEVEDTSDGMVRTEVKSKIGGSHLGHVFQDGPTETGLRFCINSASLDFIPVDKLEDRGYGKYKVLFIDKKNK